MCSQQQRLIQMTYIVKFVANQSLLPEKQTTKSKKIWHLFLSTDCKLKSAAVSCTKDVKTESPLAIHTHWFSSPRFVSLVSEWDGSCIASWSFWSLASLPVCTQWAAVPFSSTSLAVDQVELEPERVQCMCNKCFS